MANGALFVGWGPILPGREKAARKVLDSAMRYLQRMKQQGTIESIEAVILEPHGGELGGFVLVKGDKQALANLRGEEEFVRLIVGVQLVHANVGVVGAYAGGEMQALLRIWDEEESKLDSGSAG